MIRDYYFDNLKFLLIVTVVVGHALEPLYHASDTVRALYNLIYFFHIPLFVFVTGYFSKKLDKLAPFVVLYVLFEMLYTIFDYFLFGRSDLVFSFFLPHWLMWYLLAVILWKLILPYITRLRHPIIAASGLAVLAGYATKDLGYAFASLRAVNFLPFFLAGYYLNRSHLELLTKRWIRAASALVLPLAFAALFLYGQDIDCKWLWGSFDYRELGHPEWYAGIYRLAYAGGTVLLAACVLSLTPTQKTIFSGLGSRTICPYLLHGFVLITAESAGIYRHLESPVGLLLLIVSSVALAVLLSLAPLERALHFLFRPNLSFLFKPKERKAASFREKSAIS